MAQSNPFLVAYNHEIEGIFAKSVPRKVAMPCVVEYVKSVIFEFGYGEKKKGAEQ